MKDVEETFKTLSSFINGAGGSDFAELSEKIAWREHRYLQEEFFVKVVLELIKHWSNAYTQERFDARNEYTVKTCHKLAQFLQEEDNFFYMP